MKKEPLTIVDKLGEEAGAFYLCKRCGEEHEIKFGIADSKKNKIAGFVDCGESSYLVTIDGKLI
jgi:hypothetical protein